MPSGVVAFWRLALGALVAFGWAAASGRLPQLRLRAHRLLLVATGVVLGIHWVLEFEAFERLDVATAILIVFVGPVLWVLGAPAVLGERLRPLALGSLAVAFAGLGLITLPGIGSIDAWGIASALGAAVLFAALILGGKLLTAHYEPIALTVWQLAIGSVVVAPFLVRADAGEVARAFPLLVVLGAAYTGVLGILFFRAVRALEAQQLGVLFYLEPASAVLYAWAFLDERPAAATLAGGVLIVAAGLAIILAGRAAPAREVIP